ncbi:MAG: hypothetical protein ISS25_01670 [Nanoarchaeota archaeon]|nr:hypothetical protein [DPANN group archaeon]MBL7116518.1 hypothetical protein [Nanoarchaeota archaeon]
MAKDCPVWMNWVVLIVGILYLLADLGVFAWWGDTISWWTVMFVLLGLWKVTS